MKCERCGGKMFAERDAYGGYQWCLNCANIVELAGPPQMLLGHSETRSQTTTETFAKKRQATHAHKTLNRYEELKRR